MPKLEEFQSGTVQVEQFQQFIDGYNRVALPVVLVAAVLSIIGYGVASLVAFQQLSGKPRPLGDNLTQALSRFFPLIGVYLLWSLGVMAGNLLFVIPGFMLAVRWGGFGQVCVIEKTGPIASLKRSAELTNGNRWPLFGLAILVYFGVILVYLPFGLPLMLIPSIPVQFFGGLLLNAVIVGYLYCLSVAVYQELRRVKEGMETPATMSVFN